MTTEPGCLEIAVVLIVLGLMVYAVVRADLAAAVLANVLTLAMLTAIWANGARRKG